MSVIAPVPDLAALAGDLRDRLFTPQHDTGGLPFLGAEVELLPIDVTTGRVAALQADAPVSTLRAVRAHARRALWDEEHDGESLSFVLPDLGTITFEPGGQLEYSAPPCRGATELLRRLRRAILPLDATLRTEGIALLAAGIDPANGIEDAPLQLRTDRYRRMADYFARLGGAGARMMRQTAAFQVALDVGPDPFERWVLLNALAPYVTAIFANSPRYAGRDTGGPSFRARTWRSVDGSRTGIPCDPATPVAAYLEFALCAPDLLRDGEDGPLPFVGWLARGEATTEQWERHLTTLFPEVRPRGYFEVRSADALPPEWWAAPLALLAGIAYHRPTHRAAADLLGHPDPAVLRAASEQGLRDRAIARVAADLATLALEGCAALGPSFISPADLAEAREFFERFTLRGLAPADLQAVRRQT